MFKLATDPTFTHPVKVMVPIDGGHREETFKATFRVIAADGDERDLNTAQGSTSFLKEAVVKLDDIAGADDQPLSYSDELRDQLLALPYVRSALARTYFQAVSKAAPGN